MSGQFKKDYFGFVYLWRDSRSGMFCIGSHLGNIDDGYVSSTGSMPKAFMKRPADFKRRIIYWLRIDDREVLLAEENRLLSMIKDSELSTVANFKAKTVRYYNCKKFAIGGAWNKGQSGVQIYPKRQCEHCEQFFSHAMYAAWHGERCLKNPNVGDLSFRERKKQVKQPAYVADNVNTLPHEQCLVCGIVTSRGNISRWHGPNCKPRRQRRDVIARRGIDINHFAGTRDELAAVWPG